MLCRASDNPIEKSALNGFPQPSQRRSIDQTENIPIQSGGWYDVEVEGVRE